MGSIDPIDREVGARLAARRRALGLRREDLAGVIGVSRQQVINYERGVSRTPVAALVRAAVRLETSAAWLAGGDAPSFEDGPDGQAQTTVRLLDAFARMDEAARASLLVLARGLARFESESEQLKRASPSKSR